MSTQTLAPSAPPPAPGGWNRPVTRRALLLVSLLTALLWLALVVAGFFYVRREWVTVLEMRDQPVQLRLPEGLAARAEVAEPVLTHLESTQRLRLPLNQEVRVQVQNNLKAHTVIDTVVPVHTVVNFEGDIPVDTTVSAEVPVVSWWPSFPVTIPVKVVVPVKVAVPVSAQIPLALALDVSGELAGPLRVPIKTVLDTQVVLRANVRAQVSSSTDFSLLSPVEPFGVDIRHARFQLPMSDFGWTMVSGR
ncbi:MAG TPA: hypothetical protein H9903_13975 [Candidatus Aquabacterium excrementipullorum]|nr:hypothetical protein [Candidatus Aquabacterium excrementipullorum]